MMEKINSLMQRLMSEISAVKPPNKTINEKSDLWATARAEK